MVDTSFSRTILRTYEDIVELCKRIKAYEGWLSFDTETTGLDHMFDIPFLITLTFDVYSYALDITNFSRGAIQSIFDSMGHIQYVIGHNVKFDKHMLENIGVIYKYNNLTDTMIMARLSLGTEHKGLSLKGLSTNFLDNDAHYLEKLVAQAKTRLNRKRTKKLTETIKDFGWLKKDFDAIVKQPLFEMKDLGLFEETYTKFLDDYPEINYLDIFNDEDYKDIMYDYAMYDTELTLKLAYKFYPVMVARRQKDVFDRENKLIEHLYNMERVGFKIDREYLEVSRLKVKDEIIKAQKQIDELCGQTLNVKSPKQIKDLFKEFGIDLKSSDADAMRYVRKTYQGTPGAIATLISKLISLRQWYKAYIIRMLNKSSKDGRAYTMINQSSTKTGRVTSDFQQFPKKALKDAFGVELYHPRKAIIVTGGAYPTTMYFDYSQIELRVQAQYTIEVSGGDLNMCRAYMPFRCYRKEGIKNIKFDYSKPQHIEDIFVSKWYREEDDTIWSKTDLHSATTHEAFPDLEIDSPEFLERRGDGKSTNFAKNYGGGMTALLGQGHTGEIAKALDDGYYKAFPLILDFQKLVNGVHARRGYVTNKYGRRYYLSDRRLVYKLYNYLCQGTSADMLKEKIISVGNMLKPYKTRFQMNIHDEMSFEFFDGEEFLIPLIKKEMEDVEFMSVPVVADVEITRTNWKAKVDY